MGKLSLYPFSKNCKTLSQGEESRNGTSVVVPEHTRFNTLEYKVCPVVHSIYESDYSQKVNLHSGRFTVTAPVVGQMCHVKEVRYWFGFSVEHLVAVSGQRP